MYQIVTTPGLIIDSRPRGEAGKTLSIFTRDLGLIQATAQGIRLEKSKLRYHAQEYSFGVFSVVRGKEFWRLTSAAAAPSRRQQSSPSSPLIVRIAQLLRRLLHGEEAHPELFECIEACERFIEGERESSDQRLKALESITVLRMLHALGYIGSDPLFDELLKSNEIDTGLLDEVAGKRAIINQHINKALQESHL